jgi:hypothetical protein
MKMNKRKLALRAALMSAVALTSVVPGIARAENLSRMFPVEFGTGIAWNGKTTITGLVHNNGGHAGHHLRVVIDGPNEGLRLFVWLLAHVWPIPSCPPPRTPLSAPAPSLYMPAHAVRSKTSWFSSSVHMRANATSRCRTTDRASTRSTTRHGAPRRRHEGVARYAHFTEGFASADLGAATALLSNLL